MEQKGLIFGEDFVNKNKFYIYEKSIDIDKVDLISVISMI